MIELQRKTIAIRRDGTFCTMRTSNTKKSDRPIIEPNATDNDWALFLDAWTQLKKIYRLTDPVEIHNELRMTCSPIVNIFFFDLIGTETLNSATVGILLVSHLICSGKRLTQIRSPANHPFHTPCRRWVNYLVFGKVMIRSQILFVHS